MGQNAQKIIAIWFFLSLFVASAITACAQDELEPAEVIGLIQTVNNKIPSIQIGNFTVINITVHDVFGINWTRLSSIFPLRAQYLWPIIHPSWKRFLGYTSLRFDPAIVEGNPRGWYVKVDPTAIAQADQGRTYDLKLYVETDDIAVDYAVVVGIKVTRADIYGADFGQSTIYVPVKASSLNNIKMVAGAGQTQKVAPHSFGYFDVTIENFGYYRDMYQLHFTTENNIRVEAATQVIVLNPGDSQNVRIQFLTPEKLYDIGTPNTIEVYVTSTSDQTPELIGTLVVITEGVFISPLYGFILAPIIIILILVYLFFFFYRSKRDKELYGKPEKPWKLAEEQEHLRTLKQTDPNAYKQELGMMKEEYGSALLFYKDDRQSLKPRPIEPVSGEPSEVKERSKLRLPALLKKKEAPEKKEEQPKPQPLQRVLALFKREKKTPPKVEEKKVEPAVPAEDKSKEKALAKIKREQEKQLKKKKQ